MAPATSEIDGCGDNRTRRYDDEREPLGWSVFIPIAGDGCVDGFGYRVI